jgi:hypothetical protein
MASQRHIPMPDQASPSMRHTMNFQPIAPRYAAWEYLLKHGTWPGGEPDWAPNVETRVDTTTAMYAVIDELAALVSRYHAARHGATGDRGDRGD